MNKYITVLDFEIGKVFQYENLKHLEHGWNKEESDDHEVIEWYLTEVKGHRLSNIEWMLHEDNEIITN
jgi:hypothetical protein